MSFGLRKSFGHVCKVESFKQLYETGMRPRTFTELLVELTYKDNSIFERPGRIIINTRAIIKIKRIDEDSRS